MNKRDFFRNVDGIRGHLSAAEKEIKRLIHIIEEKRRAGRDFDDEAQRLAILRSDLLGATIPYRPPYKARLDIQCGGTK